MRARLRLLATVLLLGSTACGGVGTPYTAPAPSTAAVLGPAAVARLLVGVFHDPDPQLTPPWQERCAKAAAAVDAALRAAHFRTVRDPGARSDLRVIVSCPIRGADFSVVVEAKRKVLDRLDVSGADWGDGELGQLGQAAARRLERSEAVAALAGADLAVTGEITQVGDARVLVMKLFEVSSGVLLGSRDAQAKDGLALIEAARPAAKLLFQ